MENDPTPDDPDYPGKEPTIDFRINGEDYVGRKDNTVAYIHKAIGQSIFDHIFHQVDQEDEEAEPIGYYIFRDRLKDFDKVVEYMRLHGFGIYTQDYPSDMDRRAYISFYGEPTQEMQPITETSEPLPPLDDLTPRRESRPLFLRWLLDHGRLDFSQEGDLYL